MKSFLVVPLFLFLVINIRAQGVIFKKVLTMNFFCSNTYIDYVYNYYKDQEYITFNFVLFDSNTIRIWMSAETADCNSVNEEILNETSLCVSILDKVILLSNSLIRDNTLVQLLPSLPIKSHHPLYIKDGLKELIIYITPERIVFYPLIIEGICAYSIEPHFYNYLYETYKRIKGL